MMLLQLKKGRNRGNMVRNKKVEKLSREIEFLLKRSRKLREEDLECHTLIRESGLSIVHIDREYTISFYYDFSMSIPGAVSGTEMEEGRNFFEFVSGRDADYCRQCFEQALNGEPATRERRVEVPGGSVHWFSMFFYPLFSESGNISGVCLAVLDITGQKQVEDDLKTRNEELETLNSKVTDHDRFFHALLDSIPVPVFFKDSQCRYLGCNKAYTRMTGLDAAEILGKTAAEIWPKDFSGEYHQKDLELLENPSRQEFEYKIKSRTGRIHDVIYCKNVFRNDQDEIAGIVGTLSEITDLKKTQLALKTSEEQFRLLYEKAPIGYHSLDPEGRLIIVNQTWLDTLGYEKDEVIGRSFTEFMTDESWKIFNSVLGRIMEGQNETSSELQLIKIGGDILDASFNGIAIRDTSGNFLRTHCVFIDISKEKEIMRTLKKVAGQAEGLKGFIPICAGCKNIQDLDQPKKPWIPPAQYISERLPDIRFSHGMCPDCMRKWYPEYEEVISDN
jgi:PAS domain S-box-containing protein